MEQPHEIQRCGNGLRLKLAELEEAWFGAVVLALAFMLMLAVRSGADAPVCTS